MMLARFATLGGGVEKDPFFNLTTLLLPGNGTNGAQNNTFLDSGTANGGIGFPITRTPSAGPNAPTQGTFSPFSQTGWSASFNGSSDDVFALSADTANAMGSVDFTVEAFVFPRSFTATSFIFDTLGNGAGPTNAIRVQINTSGVLGFLRYSSVVASGGSIPLNSWSHIAVCKSGGTLRLYVNGSQVASIADAVTYVCGASRPIIGREGYAVGQYFNGLISNVRAIKGTALYTGSYTVPTAPLTPVSGTSLLTLQDNRFKDNSGGNYGFTVEGTPSVQAFSPFAPNDAYRAAIVGGSAYFDGADDSLSVSSTNALFNIGANVNFTYEAWFYSNNASAIHTLLSLRQDSSGWAAIEIQTTTSRTLTLNISQTGGAWANSVSSTATFDLGTWNHIALVRNGASINLYLNGTSIIGPVTNSNSLYSTPTEALRISGRPGGSAYLGYISNVRYVHNQALTTGNFTSPTAPLTTSTVGWTGANVASSITGTVAFLGNFTNAGIADATAKNVLETVGGAQISTTQSKFGGSSIFCDGNGDYLKLPSSPVFAMGGGNWTVEMWLYPNSVATLQALLSFGSTAWRFFLNNSGLWFLNSSTSIVQTAQSIVATGQWYHVAVCKSGSSVRIFLNGQQVGSTGTDNNTYAAGIAYIGSEAAGSYLNGYINDLRVTKHARYTANFPLPTAAFLTQ